MKIVVAVVAVEKTLTLCLTYAGTDLQNMSNAQDSRVDIKIIQTNWNSSCIYWYGNRIASCHKDDLSSNRFIKHVLLKTEFIIKHNTMHSVQKMCKKWLLKRKLFFSMYHTFFLY